MMSMKLWVCCPIPLTHSPLRLAADECPVAFAFNRQIHLYRIHHEWRCVPHHLSPQDEWQVCPSAGGASQFAIIQPLLY